MSPDRHAGRTSRYEECDGYERYESEHRYFNRTPTQPAIGGFYNPSIKRRHNGHESDDQDHAVQTHYRKPDKIVDASVTTRDKCRVCPMEWIHSTLMLCMKIPSDCQIRDHDVEHSRQPEEYAFVHEPTTWARYNVLSILDTNGSSVTASTIAGYIRHRCAVGRDFPPDDSFLDIPLSVPENLIKSWFNVNLWYMSTDLVAKPADRFHIVDFARVLDTSYPKTALPAEGYPLHFARRMARLIYNSMSLIGLDDRKGLEDLKFKDSAFGQALWTLCQVPYTFQLDPARHFTPQQTRRQTTENKKNEARQEKRRTPARLSSKRIE